MPVDADCDAHDLDDIEDEGPPGNWATDQVTTQAEYDAANWKHDQDVEIVLSSLDERTDYTHIYCYAEDDQPAYPYNGPNVITEVMDCSAAISQDNLAPQLEVRPRRCSFPLHAEPCGGKPKLRCRRPL